MRNTLPLLALAAGLAVPSNLGAEQKDAGTYLKVAMTTGDKYSRDEKTAFAPDSPAVYAVYRIVAARPVKLRAVFWADAAEGLGSKTQLLEKVVSISEKGEFMGAVQALKPANGWPVGAYHVDLYVDDALAKTLPFKVVRRPGAP